MAHHLSASDLARRLSHRAESVCRHYLPAGRKVGRYWLVGDVLGTPGRSLYVRLAGPDHGKGAAGKWTDAATGEHGDLLDLLALNRGLPSIHEANDEAQAFLSLPLSEVPSPAPARYQPSMRNGSEAARRLFAMSRPIVGTPAAAYLRHRAIRATVVDCRALRFHPRCYNREGDDAPLRTFPAMIAAVTEASGLVKGVYRLHQDEPDPRPLPDETAIQAALVDIFDAFVSTLGDTRLESDLEGLLWSTVSLFHRAADRVQRELDRNEDAQRRSQGEQDGSEVRSVELERLTAEGVSMIERRGAMEFFRERAAELFEIHVGSAWHPRTGSHVNHRTLTAAMIDSRDFLAAKRRAETEPLIPAGVKIAFAGGLDCNDYHAIWDTLDKVHAKHPEMVLLHGGAPKGAEFIASRWADTRKVAQIAFRPDWARHAKAAPFKRNDQLLQALPIGLVIFPGSGITENLADKAKSLGIPVWRFRSVA